MKKIIGILSIICVLTLGGITYVQTAAKEYDKDGYLLREREELYIESPFEQDPKVKELLEHIVSVRQKNEGKEENGSIGVGKTGAVSTINISGVHLPKYREQIEKIERVLELDGLVEYIYGEKQADYDEVAFSQLKERENVKRFKKFEDVLVTVRQYKSHKEEASEKSKAVSIKILRDKLKGNKKSNLIEELEGDEYYLANILHGGEEEVIVFNNLAELTLEYNGYKMMDENGQVSNEIPANMRYEILTKENKVEYIRGVARARNNIHLNKADIEMLLRSAGQLGLDDRQLMHLRQVVEETLANPLKNRKEKIGEWEYQARYTKEEQGEGVTIIYLDITLK